MSTFKVGDQVFAVRQIVEGGAPLAGQGDPTLKVNREGKTAEEVFPKLYIHEAGEVGTIEYINDDGIPTVRFKRTGTATIVDPEVEIHKDAVLRWDDLKAVKAVLRYSWKSLGYEQLTPDEKALMTEEQFKRIKQWAFGDVA